MRQGRRVLLAASIALLAVALAPAVASAGPVRAGVGVVDATWHVGASAGQYATTRNEDPTQTEFDPSAQSVKNKPSYGVQTRLQARAIVVEGADGKRFALVKNDLYIPQDLLWRRTAQILAAGKSGINESNLTVNVTHDHSSPYYSSTGVGAWTFQDVYDVRFYNYYAHQMAAAVEQAAAHLKPVRVGATVTDFDKTPRNALGPAVADDGTPAGFPDSYTDRNFAVVRFDDVSSPAHPKPLAVLVNFSLHGEMLNGNDLIAADWVGPLQRLIDRRVGGGAVTIFTQNAVGNSEPERSSYHSVHERLDFTHREYAQNEYAARLMSDAAVAGWRRIGERRPDPAFADHFVPFQSGSFPVAFEDHWFPGPVSHPFPSVSNCRTDKGLNGDPQVPVAGLPDCEGTSNGLSDAAGELGLDSPPTPPTSSSDPGLSTDDFERAGIPVPENYGAPGTGGLEEDASVHLQAFRLGDILFTVCSCEQWADQARNIKTRTDTTPGNEWLGYDWSARCTRNANGTWTCPDPTKECLPNGDGTKTCRDPQHPDAKLAPISDEKYRRMKAQVNNPANGWNDPANAPYAESEPVDTTKIKGNYTHDDDAASAKLGYRLTVPISMANDYNGYIATYREYQRGDHYRKALTAWGPHSSDYMATRLVGMGRHLHGGPAVPPEPLDAKSQADLAANDQKASALGRNGEAATRSYEAQLPDDGGRAEIVTQPRDAERFGATSFTWNGGSNFTDDPSVRVERLQGGRWVTYADQSGEIPVTLRYPQQTDAPAYETGGQRWLWTATFEAFVSRFALWDALGREDRATPPGAYRFLVEGHRRQGGKVVTYRLISQDFAVNPWSGITIEHLARAKSGRVGFDLGPRHRYTVGEGASRIAAEIGPIDYPDSYRGGPRFIKDERTAIRDPDAPKDPSKLEWYCFTCTFRPWLDYGDAVRASLTVIRPNGTRYVVPAVERNGRWLSTKLIPGTFSAFVAPGCVQDAYGDYNRRSSGVVGRSRAPVAGCAVRRVPCRDHLAPRTTITRRGLRVTARGVVLRGRSRDRDCMVRAGKAGRDRGRVVRVYVAVGHIVPHGCRFLLAGGRFAPRRSCRKPSFLRARVAFDRRRHLSTFSFARGVRLPRGIYGGVYDLIAYGVDRRGNVESRRRVARYVQARRR